MKILNEQFLRDVNDGRTIRLNLGSGETRRPDFYCVDHLALPGVDILADLNEPLSDVPSDCVDEVYSRHTLEHIHQFLPLMREIHRICRAGARIEIIVPHFSNVYGYSDPTHVRFFGLYTMNYFVDQAAQPRTRKVPTFYTDARFVVDSIAIQFYAHGRVDKLLSRPLARLINRSVAWQDFYERRLSAVLHAWQIVYLMRPDKSASRVDTGHS